MRKPLRLALWIGGGALLLGGATLLIGYHAVGRVPEWYEEATAKVDSQRQHKASDQMEQRVADLTSGVNTTGKWEVLFTAEQINGWLAVALKEKHPELLPPEFTDPRVVIEPDGITLAARFQRGAIQSVVSLKVDVSLSEPNVIAARLCEARAGSLPWPLGKVLDAFSQAAAQQEIPLRWRQTDGDPTALITIPVPAKNKKRPRIETLRLGDGELYIAGATEKR